MPMKLTEPQLDKDNPWNDDRLNRKSIADALTNLLAEESNPFVISLDGNWGTGKTFLLKRWQAQLRINGFKSVYFNAWEDDYCGDPLVAIIGQLWEKSQDPEEFPQKSDLTRIAESLKEAAKPLLINTTFNALKILSGGFVDINPEMLKSTSERAIDDYFALRANKVNLVKHLEGFADEVRKITHHPLVFIIDELDRCRPTFAIETLERLKHIFNIKNLVFVLGVDRRQLSSCIRSVYGDIDVDGYLRRFFDMEFTLPEADSMGYCKILMQQYALEDHLDEIPRNGGTYGSPYNALTKISSKLCEYSSMSLRDIQYYVRTLAFVARNINNEYSHPILLAILLFLRLKNPELYRNYVDQKCRPAKVLDYIEPLFLSRRAVKEYDDDNLLLNQIRRTLYATDGIKLQQDNILIQIKLWYEDKELTSPDALSEATKKMSGEEKKTLYTFVDGFAHTIVEGNPTWKTIQFLVGKIELAALIHR